MVSKAVPQASAVFNRKLMRKQKDIMFRMQCAISMKKKVGQRNSVETHVTYIKRIELWNVQSGILRPM